MGEEREGREVRRYTEKASEDLLFKVLEKEFNEAMQDVLENRRKITDPDVMQPVQFVVFTEPRGWSAKGDAGRI